MELYFTKLPAEFSNHRIYLCPITKSGVQLEFFTDTGGGGMFIASETADKLELPIVKKKIENGEQGQYVPFPEFKKDASIPTRSESDELFIVKDIPWGEGFLGHTWFANKILKLDYLKCEMGYANNDSKYLVTDYQSLPISFKQDSNGKRLFSFPRIEATIDGEPLDFLFDTGATVNLTDKALDILGSENGSVRGTSFITRSVFEKWRKLHPDWPVIEEADHFDNQSMIQVPKVEIAGLVSGPVWFTTRPNPNFHQFMSGYMDKQVDGALGGSLFKYFTIIVDYPNSIAYFKL